VKDSGESEEPVVWMSREQAPLFLTWNLLDGKASMGRDSRSHAGPRPVTNKRGRVNKKEES
jgi:hypothetical protein